MLKTFKTV